jgi:hypothetical protein
LNFTSGDNFGINSSESQLLSGGRIYDLKSGGTKSLTEFAAAAVGLTPQNRESTKATHGIYLLLHARIAAPMKMVHSVAARTIVVAGTPL